LRCIALHPTKALAAIGSSDNNIYLVDLTQKKLQNTLKHHKNSVFSVVFSPCGNYLWSGGRDAQLTVWVANSENNYELLHTIPAHLFTINKLILIPEYKLIISASRDKSIKLWSTKTLQLCKVLDKSKPNLTMHSHSINNLLYLSNSQQLLAASDDRNISLWQLSSTN
jgi:WD40 repeat protein